MAITIDGKTYRNMQEQVAKNAEDIAALYERADPDMAAKVAEAALFVKEANGERRYADHVGSYELKYSYSGTNYTLTLSNFLFNAKEAVAMVNQIAGTSFETLEEVDAAWPTICSGVVSAYGLLTLATTLAGVWLNSKKLTDAAVSHIEENGEERNSNAMALVSGGVEFSIGALDISSDLSGGSYSSCRFTHYPL